MRTGARMIGTGLVAILLVGVIAIPSGSNRAFGAAVPIKLGWVGVDVWANKITGLGYPEVFRVAPTNALIMTQIGGWLVAAGFKNIAILQEKTDSGINARQTLEPILTAKGIKYDVVETDLNTTDFTAQILRFKSQTPP